MATTKIWSIHSNLKRVIEYTTEADKVSSENANYLELHNVIEYAKASYKTEEQLYVSGVNCIADKALDEMIITKRQYGKTDGILAFHAFQSFVEGEVTAEQAHEIGVRLAEEMWGDRFEVVVSTHLNTKHIHNHFVINSVSFKDGQKYYANIENYALLRATSDALCEEYKLSVLKEKPTPNCRINYENYLKSKFQNSKYYITTKEDIDRAIGQAVCYEDFENILKAMDYTLTYRGGKLSVCRYPYKRNIRVHRAYGEEYSCENIEKRIMTEQSIRVPFQEVYSRKRKYTKSKRSSAIPKQHRSSIYRLYLYYRYLIGSYQKKKIRKPISESLREEIKRMEQISEEARFLDSKGINTIQELSLYKNTVQTEIENLTREKKSLYDRTRIVDSDESELLKEKSLDLTFQIKVLRKELRLCEDIERRLPKIKENLIEMEDQKVKGKERDENEHIR